MAGLTFTLGGKVDPTYQASLNRAVTEAKAAGMRIQSSLRTQIGGLDKQLATAVPGSAEAVAIAARRQHLSNALLIAQNGQYLAAAKARIAATESEGVAAAAAVGKIAGLNVVIRESIVLLREFARGNFSRMAGSASIMAQGLSHMGPAGKALAFLNRPLFNSAAANAEGAAAGKAAATGLAGALASIPLVTMALVAGSVAAIIAAPILFFHRVKKLAAELQTTLASTFRPEHLATYLGKLEILNQLERDIAQSARNIREAHDSVSNSMQRELDLTKDRIGFERELLEIQKANALAAAKNPEERAAIEKKFSGLILAKKKEERDAELNAMREEANKLPAEIGDAENKIKDLTSGAYMTEGVEKQNLDNLRAESDKWNAYREQLDPQNKDTREHSADKDRATIARLAAREQFLHRIGGALSDTDQANLDAANGRLKNAADAQNRYRDFANSGDARARERARVKELENKVKSDEKRLAELGDSESGKIHDTAAANLQKDQEDLRLEQERLKRVDAGRPLNGREVTERERVGLGSPQVALLDVNKSMDRKLGTVVELLRARPGGAGTFNDPLAGF
jgi:hypothetical protein